MRTKTVDISRFTDEEVSYNDPVVLKKPSGGDKADITDHLIQKGGARLNEKGEMENIPLGTMRIMYLQKCIKDSGFDRSIQGIRDLPGDIFDYLFAEAERFNNPLGETKEVE